MTKLGVEVRQIAAAPAGPAVEWDADPDEQPRPGVPRWRLPAAVLTVALLALTVVALVLHRTGQPAAGPADTASATAGDDARRIQGLWKVVSVQVDGVRQEDVAPRR